MSSTTSEGLRWVEFAADRPDVARAGRQLLYQFGVGLAFLGTVRSDGGPRIHPFCPVLHAQGLYAFIVPSPKRADLRRDGRYAMHAFPSDDNEDAFYVTGTVRLVKEDSVRKQVDRQYSEERPTLTSIDLSDQELFEFFVETAMLTVTIGHGDPEPTHTVWRAPTKV